MKHGLAEIDTVVSDLFPARKFCAPYVAYGSRAAVMLAKLIENTLSQGRSRLACHYRFGESRDQVPRLNVLKAGVLDEGPNETGRQDDSFRAIEHAGEEP